MPIVSPSYKYTPFFLATGHWETIYPALVRRVRGIHYDRERLFLSDGDFVDLDWIENDSDNLVILVHGLEGNTERHYMKGMASMFDSKQWDVLAWNCRSCSGELNNKLRLYNHGEIGDIAEVISHALNKKDYRNVSLIGFSMGASIILKYLGVNAGNLPKVISSAVAFSSPTDLKESAAKLDEPALSFYRKRFHKMLADKIVAKAELFPDKIDASRIYDSFEKWEDFDDAYSAPLNGYKDAQDFYHQSSANLFIPAINIPTLLVNAQNDPILTPNCFPEHLALENPHFYLEMPEKGGHVGFSWLFKKYAWSEYRAWEFVEQFSK